MAKDCFTIKQAANFLKVTDSVIKEMIKSKVFKATRKGNVYQIEKAEVEEWLANLNECRFSDYFKARYIFLDFYADNKYEAIAEMSKKAKDLKIVKDHRWLYQVVVAREELVSTAIGKGVALLHPRHLHPSKVKKPAIIFGRSKNDVEFDAIDNQPVRLFFMLLLHNDAQHLFSISYISKLLMNEANLKVLRSTSSTEEIEKALTKNVLR
jgi:excisionase family DNA binding protein